MVTQQELKAWIHYDPATGQFTRVERRGRWAKGSTVGSMHPKGYVWVCRMEGGRNVNYMAHRLAWLWMTGEWPSLQIDHINGQRNDNRWSNLRLATAHQNQWNTGVRADNTSGFKGVTRPAGRTKWHAYINDRGKRRYIGSFHTAEEANEAATNARRAAHGEFAR